MPYKTILIPVESQVRELDGKLLLACTAAAKGFTSIIGSRSHIHFYSSRINNCIYIAKSMRRFSERMFKILHQLGHKIVAWDEEGLVRLPDQQYYMHRLSPVTFSYIDHLFAWGESNARVFRNYSGYKQQPIHSFGNPRIDIIRPELRSYFQPEVDSIVKAHGNYILINTNFGQINHFIPSLGKKETSRDKNFAENSSDQFTSRRHAHKTELFSHFRQTIPLLADTFPDIKFVVRPHPSENTETWKKLLGNKANTFVSNEGNVIPWIMGSKALISNGCTTSIESTILGKPTLGYYPVFNDEVDDIIPKALCDIATSGQELVIKIRHSLAHQDNSSPLPVILNEHIANLSGPLACDNIINTLYDAYYHLEQAKIPLDSRIKGFIHNEARTLVKHYNSMKKEHRNSSNYHKHRYPEISTEYIHEKIKRLDHLTNRFEAIEVKQISKYIFKITG